MWSRRKKEEVSDDDAELRALANAYAQLHDRNKPTSSADEIQSSQTPQTQASTPVNMDAVPELPQDDMIQGNSISYTRAEAKLYANEEPCDSWRHFDVIPVISIFILGMVPSSSAIAHGLGFLSVR
jgi:hypothetical protein